MAEINIAFGATEDWLENTAVVATSILKNANEKDFYNFYIISNKFNKKHKQEFLVLNKIKESNWNFILTKDKDYKKITHSWLGCSTYYRLKLPSMVDKDKILYLDSDIVVLKDIAELYNTDITDYYCAAIEDKEFGMRYIIRENEEEAYYNGGVLLINLKKFREDSLEEKMYNKLLEKHWSDQDVFNDVCYKNFLSLPLKYNIMLALTPYDYRNRRVEYECAIKNPVIMHFSQCKPWTRMETPFPYTKKWLEYRDLHEELKKK